MNSETTNGNNHIVIKNLKLDGNKGNNTSGTQRGILFTKVAPSGTTPGCKIEGCFIENFRNDGIYLWSSSNNTISGNTCQGNKHHGIYLDSSPNNTISGNTCSENSQATDNSKDNIYLSASDYNLIVGNVCRRGTLTNKPKYGINISSDTSDRNCLIGNDLYDSGSTGDLNDVPTTNPTLKHDNRNNAGTGWLAEA